MPRQKICPCGKPSVPGLVKGVALCQEHFTALMYKTGPEHAAAVKLLDSQKK